MRARQKRLVLGGMPLMAVQTATVLDWCMRMLRIGNFLLYVANLFLRRDLLAILAEFGCTEGCTTDVNNDGLVTVADLLELLSVYGATC